jgi:hypothetical protein
MIHDDTVKTLTFMIGNLLMLLNACIGHPSTRIVWVAQLQNLFLGTRICFYPETSCHTPDKSPFDDLFTQWASRENSELSGTKGSASDQPHEMTCESVRLPLLIPNMTEFPGPVMRSHCFMIMFHNVKISTTLQNSALAFLWKAEMELTDDSVITCYSRSLSRTLPRLISDC